MKILHLSDLHYSEKSLSRLEEATTAILGDMEAMGAELCIISGDVFDAPLSAHSEPFIHAIRMISEISSYMPVHIIYGTRSHDHPGALSVFGPIAELTDHPITIESVPESRIIRSATGRECLVYSIPGLNRTDHRYQDIDGIIAGFAERDPDIPSILTAHGSVAGSVTESGFAIVSNDHEFTTEQLAGAECDAVMLGHIHKHQFWNEESPSGRPVMIAYSGSLTRLTYGQRDAPGFLLWDVEPGETSFEFIDVPCPDIIHIEYPGPPDMTDLARHAYEIQPDDLVRIRWTVDSEHAHEIDRTAIAKLFEHVDLKLEGSINPVQSVRAEKINLAPSLAEKIEQWLETTGDRDRVTELIERSEILTSFDEDEIIRRIT
jgi:exonuclease SbcD